MSRRTAGAFPLLVTLDADAHEPLTHQLYEAVRKLILSGRALAGIRLPSTRVLSSELRVSRNTVINAFERLAAEGYIEAKAGGGTRVSRTLPDTMAQAGVAARRRAAATVTRRPSHRGADIAAIRTRRWSDRLGDVRPFRLGVGALSEFPLKTWARLSRRRLGHSGAAAIDYDEIAGYMPLRQAIAGYLRSARGVVCDAAQVIIVNGSQQALDLASRVLLDPGDAVWFENPGYDGARGAFLAAGARLVPVPVDEHGLDVATGIERNAAARLAYVTPSHQFPLGVTMTLARRRELLQWAGRSGGWIFEDDYDSEFRYTHRPLPAMQGLDTNECVIYSGSFSKVLFPALRLGYLVVPPTILDTFLRVRFLTDVHPATMTQAVLADFIAEGHFERHLRRMRLLYGERQKALVRSAEHHLGGLLTVKPSEGGMHLVGRLPAGVDDREATRAARADGIIVAPLSFFSEGRQHRNALLLGYAGLTAAQLTAGTKRLAITLRPLAQRARTGTGNASLAGGRGSGYDA
jgi:GntR family transcriptional regulator/MocR family aminotransferase